MKEEVLSFVEQKTKQHQSSTIMEISEALQKGRNLIAKTVTELMNENSLVCVEKDKKCYYHKKTLEDQYDLKLTETFYKSERLFNEVLSKQTKHHFEKLVGYENSLAGCVEMCKAAISYPQNSLPVLLNGPTGTGKSFMAQLMYEYACESGILEEGSPFVTLNCSEYANNPELLTAHLFGHKKGAFTGADSDNLGLIQAADGGILFLDEVHCLKAECQEKLFLFMDKGIYHRVGENEKWETSHIRLIFATTEVPEKVLLKTFLRRIPIIVSIPSLSERSIYERIALLHTVFSQEEKRINKKIRLSNLVYNSLLSFQFEGNIGELKNTIQVCCAHALHHCTTEELEIHMEDLPDKMFDQTRYHHQIVNNSDERMIKIEDMNQEDQNESHLLQLFDALLNTDRTQMAFINQCLAHLQEYYNKIGNHNKNANNKNEFIFEGLDSIIKKIFQKHGGKINNNDMISLYTFIEDAQRQPMNIQKWCTSKTNQIEAFYESLSANLPREMKIAKEIREKINRELDMRYEWMSEIIFALNVRLFNRNIELKKRIGIIMAHGYSTASSIADAANQLLGDYVFDAIDMAIDMDTAKVVEELNHYLKSNNNFEELVLLVDMGSLEQIYTGIDPEINVTIGIMNNITTKLALEVGNCLRNQVPIQELLKKACEGSTIHYRYIEKKNKEDVIVCACASGLGTAEKLKSLLLSSLPSDIEVKVLSYDYNKLLEQKEKSELFDKYHVLCIIGTLDPSIPSIPFIPIEELIMEGDIERIENLLSKYMNHEETELFKQAILRNFSLSNVMNYLTILNPNMLLEHVASALDEFQKIYDIHIRNNTSVGLYVHICCMVERLVMRQPLNNYANVEVFRKEHQRFISCIRQAFKEAEQYYGVQIPDDEIGYIYDYIQSGVESDEEF